MAAEAYFGANKIVYDYGAESETTSPIVRACLYERNMHDRWLLYKALDEVDFAMLCGHVTALKYVDKVGVANTITFMRDPLQRLASEYAHFCRNYNYTESLDSFMRIPEMQNKMHNFLNGVPLEAIGVVGITESYSESLDIINKRFGWGLGCCEENRCGDKALREHVVNKDNIALFNSLNHGDIELYGLASWLLETRIKISEEGGRFVHGKIQVVTVDVIDGWAWWEGFSDDPVDIEVWVNNVLVSSTQAVIHRPGLSFLSPPRGGYVGFSVPISIGKGDCVNCRVAETGQWLSRDSIVVGAG